ncbi:MULTISPECIES: DUF4365 domain-containing protein [Streptomyces]|uniref:DUF4365 domain-containing protein n=1 Tax=Streptomyces TaxID=1883 RepID=UPI00131D6895|nr:MULTISPECIES: DUF4365 domain-containing protein [Streptomyces]MDI5907805.1 DUF4365 domain-containing protein [Streptomyces sp. 12257]
MAANQEPSSRSARKRMLPTKQTERAAVNATRAFLEDHECVVQEVDTGNDYGKDLLVDLTENLEITGESIAIQVKGGASFFRAGNWGIPAKSADLRLWLDSSIPIFGLVHDPATNEIHWMNLSAYVREDMVAYREFRPTGKSGGGAANELTGHFLVFPKKQILNHETWPHFRESARAYLVRSGGHTLLNLVDVDPWKQEAAVADCFALGRGDARALLMLRQLIERLPGPALCLAARVLSHCISHPDIFWHEGNWIPQRTRKSIASTFSWTPREIFHTIREVDSQDEPEKWQRGSSGQCLFLLLLTDEELTAKLPEAVQIACSADETQAAVIMLYLYQYRMATESKPKEQLLEAIEEIVDANPKLADELLTWELHGVITEHGSADIF